MISKTKAIVLSSIKYSDNSSIVHLYTEMFGTITTLVRYGKNKKTRLKSSILQPLFLLNIEIDYKQNKNIQHCKELSSAIIFHELPFNTIKSSIAMFIAEFLNRVLKEEEKNEELFSFLYNTIQILDNIEVGTANFHLLFLYQLSKYLGIYPIDNYSQSRSYFNIINSNYTEYFKQENIYVDKELSKLLHNIANSSFTTLESLVMNGKQRSELLNIIILYYKYHIPEIGTIKSLDVLKEIFI